METIYGISNWKLTVCREANSVAILRAITCDRQAALPDELFGLPVRKLGNHALSTLSRPVQGEEVLVVGRHPAGDAGWDNRNLLDLTLPMGLDEIGNCTFLNCSMLQSMHLHDSIRSWGASALTNCRALKKITIIRTGEQGISLSYFVEDLTHELDVTIKTAEGETLRLIFPEYEESDDESFIAQAVQFQYHISGAGYLHHHCLQHRKLDIRKYDQLWNHFLGMSCSSGEALRLAWWRLRYPVELTENAAERYLAYIRGHVPEALRWLLEENDTEGLRFLLANTEPDREAFAQACGLARERQATAALALLLEEQHRRFPSGFTKNFDL